jgi:hypothetical protein
MWYQMLSASQKLKKRIELRAKSDFPSAFMDLCQQIEARKSGEAASGGKLP